MNTCIVGNIVISSSLNLQNMLYIPTFHVHLIFVPKLIISNNFHLNFSSNICHILQNYLKKMIGTTSLQRGLYIIDKHGAIYTCNSVISNSFETWNLRLGHASHFSLQIIAKTCPLIPCKKT